MFATPEQDTSDVQPIPRPLPPGHPHLRSSTPLEPWQPPPTNREMKRIHAAECGTRGKRRERSPEAPTERPSPRSRPRHHATGLSGSARTALRSNAASAASLSSPTTATVSPRTTW